MRTHVLPLGLAAILLSPCIFLSAPAIAQALSEPPLTLARAQALAASRSFAVTAAQHELQAHDGALQQAGARLNPALNASVEDTRRATRTTTATLDLPFEIGGKRAARISAAARGRAVALAELGQVQAQLRADVLRAFFAVLIAQQRVALAADSAALVARGADATHRRVAAGKLPPMDTTRAGVDVANAQLENSEAAAELLAARQMLAALWGDTDLAVARLEGDIDTLPERGTLAQLALALDDAPALLASRAEAERRRAVVAVERSKGTPDLTFSVGARRDNELGRTQAIVAVSLPLPLFDRNQGAVAEAAQRAEKAADETQLARVRLLAELQAAHHQLSAARHSAQVLQATVLPAAQQAYDAASKGFEAGKFGVLDVLDARRALLQARARHLTALAASHQAATAVDRVLGR